MKPSDVIRGALELLPDEESWSPFGWGEGGKRCIMHALEDSAGAKWSVLYGMTLDRVAMEVDCGGFPLGGSLGDDWNDDPHTTFLDVRLVLKRALARAEEDESDV